MPDRRRAALAIQAGYYIASGALPLISRKAFETLTGRKRDWWLVQMVGLLAVSIGAAIAAGLKDDSKVSRETLTLSASSAIAFAAIDTAYAFKREISPVYLADAVLEMSFAVAAFRPGDRN